MRSLRPSWTRPSAAARWAPALWGAALGLGLGGCFPQREILPGKSGAGDGGAGAQDTAPGPAVDTGRAADDDTGAPEAPGDLQATAITPDQGLATGGETAAIAVSGASAAATVQVGTAEATVVSRTDGLLRVLLPPQSVPATDESALLSVVVRDGEATSSVPGGFRAWADAGGAATTLVHLSWLRWIDVEAARSIGAEDELVAQTWLVRPTELWPAALALGTTDGGCNLSPAAPALVPATGTATLALGSARALPMAAAGDGHFTGRWAQPAGGSELAGLTGQAFDLRLDTSARPPESLAAALALPPDWSLDAPRLSELATDLPQIDGFRVAWSGARADRMAVLLRDLKGGDTVACIVENTGEFIIPEAYTAGFVDDWGAFEVELTVWAVARNATSLQYNNATMRLSGATGYRGRRAFFDWR